MEIQNKPPDRRPVDPRTGKPIGPLAQPGYYPDYSTLGQQAFWDAHTREVVLERVEKVPPIRFFTAEEARLMNAVCDHIIPQDDRDEAHRIPIVPRIDQRLYENKLDGYRFESMPPDQDAYRMGLKGIETMARHVYGRGFLEIGPREQDELLRSLHDNKPAAARDIWNRMPAHRFWMLLVQDCAEAYYAHPWAWDEIGFGGPAYPRAYFRLERGEPEPWECPERRYEWVAPPTSVSDIYEFIAGEEEHFGAPGGGGTH
jgi:hypothetical protein